MMGRGTRFLAWIYLLALCVGASASPYSEWSPGYGLARRHTASPERVLPKARPVVYVDAPYMAPLKELLGRTRCVREQNFLINKATYHTPETFAALARERFEHLDMVAILSQDPKTIAAKIPLMAEIWRVQREMGPDGFYDSFRSHIVLMVGASTERLQTIIDMCHEIRYTLELPVQRLAIARHITSLAPEKLVPICALLSDVTQRGLCNWLAFDGVCLPVARLQAIVKAGFPPLHRLHVVRHLAEEDLSLYLPVKAVLDGIEPWEESEFLAKLCRGESPEKLRAACALPKEDRLAFLRDVPPLTPTRATCSR